MENPSPVRKFSVAALIISLLITLAIDIAAALIIAPNISGWYNMLALPAFNPPTIVFPIVWTVVYVLIAISAYLVWQKRDGSTSFLTCRAVYIMQLALNFLWSAVFFGLHSIVGGLLIIILLWMVILLNIRWFGKLSRLASWLLLPYFLWVSFAAILNYSIFNLNHH